MTLDSYREKRDFRVTPEPEPSRPGLTYGALRFVVQKHAASRLHYDVRLEIDGVLKSWPVPKGPSPDPAEKRMAVAVEDHPLGYANFEGVIPRGEYGAGQMIVWDSGVYSPDEGGKLSWHDRAEANRRMRADLEKGKLSFTFRGRKLRGSWTLVKTGGGPKEWLFIKHRDEHASAGLDLLEMDRSVLSGLSIEDLKAGRLPDPWRGAVTPEALLRVGRPAGFPALAAPMMAHAGGGPFSHRDWLFEPKLDGFRVLAHVRHGAVTLRSRTGLDMTEKFPEAAAELAAQPVDEMVVDGELVALDENGIPSFGVLQQSLDPPKSARAGRAAALLYYPFDLVHLSGRDLKGLPLLQRKAMLERAVVPGDAVRLMEYVEGDGETFYGGALRMGLEGMVAKRRGSAYEAGARSRSWLKIKRTRSGEFVIGGYTAGAGARADTFGSLVVGCYDGDRLTFSGRVGSGFDEKTLKTVRGLLSGLEVAEPPFAEPVDDPREVTWTRPELVAEVNFTEWTHDGRLRAPVFLRLRPDREPGSVTRDGAAPPAAEEALEGVALEGNTGARRGAESICRGSEGVPQIYVSSLPERGERPKDGREGFFRSLPDVDDVLAQLAQKRASMVLEVGGRRISLTNLDKVFWPAQDGRPAITKRGMIRYYARMANVIVPHLRDRPLTLTRYPDGVLGQSFYQKRWDHDMPDFVETLRVFSSTNEGDVEYIMVNNAQTLVWLAQLADLELHPWLSRTTPDPDAAHLDVAFSGSEEALRASVLNYPDFIVFDLDPYIYSGGEKTGGEPELNRRAFVKTCEVARALKEILDELSLSSFVKTSGKTGLHVYVPVLRQYDFGVVRKACELIGRFLMQSRPREVTMEWAVEKRTGKVFLDHNQNVRGKNMASIYSLRPMMGAPVSTPIGWDELSDVYPTDLNIETAPERVAEMGDLWADVYESKHDLRRLLESA